MSANLFSSNSSSLVTLKKHSQLFFRGAKASIVQIPNLQALQLNWEGSIQGRDFYLSQERLAQIAGEQSQSHFIILNLRALEVPDTQKKLSFFSPQWMAKLAQVGIHKLFIVVSDSYFEPEEKFILNTRKVGEKDFVAYFSREELAWQTLRDLQAKF